MINGVDDSSSSIDELLKKIETGSQQAYLTRQKIAELQVKPKTGSVEVPTVVSRPLCEDPVEIDDDSDDEFLIYWRDYFNFSGDSLEELAAILPSRDDYHYEDIILRLKAESLREIKEIFLCGFADSSFMELAKQSIENERKKMMMLDQLLEMEEEVSPDEPELNQIILVPNMTGRIMFSEDLTSIPVDYYAEVYSLLGTIIDGTFKRAKQFDRGGNKTAIGGTCEVKGEKIRILYRRINSNTYGVYAVFLKKVMKDKRYRNMLMSRNLTYLKVENRIRKLVKNPDFMAQNDQELAEVWDVLGCSGASKTYRKVGNES